MGDGEMDEPESLGAISLAGARAARQPDLRRQLQPAAPRRPGARQRQDHPGARDGLPRRRLERHQGDLGRALGPAARRRPRRRCCVRRMEEARRRRLPDLQVARRRATCASTSSARYPELRAMVARHDRRRDLGAQPRRPRPAEGLRRLRRGGAPHGPADRDPRQDDQGLRDGRGRRGPEHHPPAEEDDRGRAAAPSATASSCRSPTSRSATRAFYKPRRRLARDGATCASAARRSAARCPRARRRAPPLRGAGARRLQGASSRAPASARSRRRWPSCASSPRCCATRRSARASCRSSPTSRAPSAWRACSASSGSSARSASSTSPRTREQLMFYREDKQGQILQEGINEAGRDSRRGSPRRRRTPTTACR